LQKSGYKAFRFLFWGLGSLFLFCFGNLHGQKEFQPAQVDTLNYSPKNEETYYVFAEFCDSILNTIQTEEQYDSLNNHYNQVLGFCERAMKFDYYDVSIEGCSWYCGGGIDTVLSSKPQKSTKYSDFNANNLFDFNHSTAWVSASTNSWIEISFPAGPKVTRIGIGNGYMIDNEMYVQYSRAKKIAVFYQNTLLGYLNLADIRSIQYFDIGKIGLNKSDKSGSWTLRLEILESYSGAKKQNIAITEISFDGVDVVH
jgi:hypothetical protein